MGKNLINLEHVTFNKEPFYKYARDRINHDSIVLDIGPGDGNFSRYCNRKDFYLFDGNIESVNSLKKWNSNVFHGLLPILPFKEHFFDLIHCSHVIEHLEPEIFYCTLKEINRCLKPGGYLVISAPLLWEGFYNDLSHVKPYYPGVISNYLCANEFNWRTRPTISSDYKVEEIVYRYQSSKITNSVFNVNGNRMADLLLRLVHILEKKGLRKYEKTGYTIILKKG